MCRLQAKPTEIRERKRKETNNTLNCIYLNVNSIISNTGELEVLAEAHKPSIILCSETCTTENVEDSELDIATYKMVRCDSHSRHTGGVIIYVHTTIDFNIIYNASVNRNIWCIIIKLKKVDKKFQIGVLYHSPNTSDADFLDYLTEILLNKYDKSNHNIVVGDFNINMNYTSTYSTKLSEIFSVMGMSQKVEFNTRITNTTETKIDLVYSNSEEIECKNLMDFKISDHETIHFSVKTSKSFKMRMVKKITAWDRYSRENLQNILRSYNFNFYNNLQIDDKVELINNNIVQAMESLTYEKEVYIKLMNKWYDHELAQMNKNKFNIYKHAIQTGVWDEYRSINKKYKKLVKIKKVKFMENKVKMSENNAKEMWKHLKQAACLTEDNDGIKKVVIDGVLVENDTEVANKLNLFFINSVIEINRNIPSIDLVMNNNQASCTFKFSNITTAEVINIIKTFKYKIGGRKLLSDGVLKDSIEYLGYFYALIINDSVESGIVPGRWKTSTVVPVKKVKKKQYNQKSLDQ